MIKTLELKNISKVIKDTVILNDINLSVKTGEILGVIGLNGSGKSSLFKVICGMWQNTTGEFFINNTNITTKYEEFVEKISFFIESPNLYENLTVKDNFKILNLINDKKDLEWLNFLVSKFKLQNFMDEKIKKCSLGTKQKIGIIMSLLNKGDVIILDEPSNSLDIESVIELYNIINILKKEGKIIFISSHIIEELESIADKFIVLDRGTIISEHTNTKDFLDVIFTNDVSKECLDSLKSIKEVISINKNIVTISILDLNRFTQECKNHDLKITHINKNKNIIRNTLLKNSFKGK